MKKLLIILTLLQTGTSLSAHDFSTYPFSGWGSYTYFYLNDGRKNGIGAAHGQNALYAANYFFNPCGFIGIYGIYQNTQTTNPKEHIFDLEQQGFGKTEGWGIGTHLNYQLFDGIISLYADYSYIWLNQHLSTSSHGEITGTVYHSSHGDRWQIAVGMNYAFPVLCFDFVGNVNYLYISSFMGGSVDALYQQLTSQDSQIGIGNTNGVLYLLPAWDINPFINGGISCDLNRYNKFPDLINGDMTTVAAVPLRNRFEWNVGAGALLTKEAFSFAISYLHRYRPGPITTNVITVYLSKNY